MTKDVTARLMGDPEANTDRRTAPEKPARNKSQSRTYKSRLTKAWLSSLKTMPVGAKTEGLTYYAAKAAQAYARMCGFKISVKFQSTDLYSIERVE